MRTIHKCRGSKAAMAPLRVAVAEADGGKVRVRLAQGVDILAYRRETLICLPLR
jgi:uncharacterized protein (DUF302 family)